MRPFALLTISAVLGLAACGPSEADVRAEIEKARACEADADCVDAGSVCPFGCSIAVNAKDADRIRALVKDFASNCMYDCNVVDHLACEQKLCTAKFQQ